MSRTEVCDQLQCELRRAECDPGRVADLVVAALAGEDVRERLDPDARIEPRARCAECVQRVMRGGRPFPSAAEHARSAEAAHRSWRRARRRLV